MASRTRFLQALAALGPIRTVAIVPAAEPWVEADTVEIIDDAVGCIADTAEIVAPRVWNTSPATVYVPCGFTFQRTTPQDVFCEQTARDLEATAAYLVRHGHIKGRFFAEHGEGTCFAGAVIRQQLPGIRQQCVMQAMHDYLIHAGHIDYYSDDTPSRWNDRESTTTDDVIAGLKLAAEWTRERARTWTAASS
jgi:hypothetical protein